MCGSKMVEILRSVSFLLFWVAFLLYILTTVLSHQQEAKESTLSSLKATLLKPISVSGFSSGGGMATQFHVAHSSLVSSVGSFASSFYRCGKGGQLTYSKTCLKNMTTVSQSIKDANSYEKAGKIDPLYNLKVSKVFVWSGKNDHIVPSAVTNKIGDFYKNFTDASNIRIVSQSARHVFPTDDIGFQPTLSFIGNCNFSGTYEMLATLLGSSIKRPSASLPTKPLIYFSQLEFTAPNTPNSIGLDNSGYYYVPSNCNGSIQCPLHIFFHGCTVGGQAYQPIFVERIGFLRMAEANNIVMLFPRAAKVPIVNPFGCWDIFGSHGDDFATKHAVQIIAVRKMVDRLFGDF